VKKEGFLQFFLVMHFQFEESFVWQDAMNAILDVLSLDLAIIPNRIHVHFGSGMSWPPYSPKPIIFFDSKGIVHKEFVLAGQTINSAYRNDVLQRLHESV
jgi:hypothetical protein